MLTLQRCAMRARYVTWKAVKELCCPRGTVPASRHFFLYVTFSWSLVLLVNSHQFLDHVGAARLMPLEPVGRDRLPGAFVSLGNKLKNPFDDEEGEKQENTGSFIGAREGSKQAPSPVFGYDMANPSTAAYVPPHVSQSSGTGGLAEGVTGRASPMGYPPLEAFSVQESDKNLKCAFQATVLVDGFHEKSLGTLSLMPDGIIAERRQLSQSIALFQEYFPESEFGLLHATPDETECLRVVSPMTKNSLLALPLPTVALLEKLPEREKVEAAELKLLDLRSRGLVAPEGAESSSMAQNPIQLMANTLAYVLEEEDSEKLKRLLVVISDSAPQKGKYEPPIINPVRETEQLQTPCHNAPAPAITALEQQISKAKNRKPVILFLVDNRVLKEYEDFAKALKFVKSTVLGFNSVTDIPKLFVKGIQDLNVCSRSSVLRTAGKVAGGVAALGALAGLGYGVSELVRHLTKPSTVPPLRPPRFPGLPIPNQNKVMPQEHQPLAAHPISSSPGEAFFKDITTLTILIGLSVAAARVWADY